MLQNDEEGDIATLSFLFKVQHDLLPAGSGKLSCQAQLFIDAYQPRHRGGNEYLQGSCL